MRNKQITLLFMCVCILFLIGCNKQGMKATNNTVNTSIATSSSRETSPTLYLPSATQDEWDLLYENYPESILIAIGLSVKKDYKTLTKNDLKKVVALKFERDHEIDKSGEYTDKKYKINGNEVIDFSILLEMPNLKEIDIGCWDIKLKDYSILCKLTNIRALTISNIDNTTVKSILQMKQLQYLLIEHSNITNLGFVANFADLRFFMLQDTSNIQDFTPLNNLQNLIILNLLRFNLSKNVISTIPDMNSLKHFAIQWCDIEEINSFPSMPMLETLSLEGSPVKSITIPPGRVPSLKELRIDRTAIKDLNQIKGTEHIESIFFRKTGIKEIAPLKKYKNLVGIYADVDNLIDKDVFKNTKVYIGKEY